MNKIQSTNKKGKHFNAILFSIFLVIISMACHDPIARYDVKTSIPNGKGSFTLTLSETARTIMPTTPSLSDFAVYNLSFIPISGGAAVSIDRTNDTLITLPVFLEPGTYRLVVNAYRDEEKNLLMAQGIVDSVTITSGNNTNATVILKSLLSGGTGTFIWNISMPSDVTSANMSIAPGNTGGTSLQTVQLMPTSATGNRTLNTGSYNLIFQIEKADGKIIEWKELLYVYRNIDSIFNHAFTNAHFSDSRYTVTYNYNDNGVTENGTQSVLHGATLNRPANPIRNNFTFTGWNTIDNILWNFHQPIIESFTLYAGWEALAPDRIELKTTRILSEREIHNNSLWLNIVEDEQLIATVWLDDAVNHDVSVSWRSSDETVAIVNDDGFVTGIRPGTAIITARTDVGGREARLNVRVFRPVHDVSERFTIIPPNSDTGKIKYSYTYDNYDFYYIYLGQMSNIPIFHPDIASEDYIGTADFSFTYTRSDIESMDVRTSISNSSSFASTIIEENTKARDDGGLLGWEEGLKYCFNMEIGFEEVIVAKMSQGVEVELKQNGETNWNNHTSKSETDMFETTRSIEITEERATSYARENAVGRGFTLTEANRPGHYRYTMFAVSDVYVYLIRDRETSSLYYEFKEHVASNVYAWRLEYSDKLPFGKTDNSNFIFDLSILNNLPAPNASFYTVTFDKNNTDIGSTEANPKEVTVSSQINIRNQRPPAQNIGMSRMPTAPERTGFTFGGWRTNSEAVFNENTPVSSNITVYAHWIPIPTYAITVTMNPSDGSSIRPEPFPKIPVGGRLNIIAIPASPHFQFTNWTRESGGTVTFDNANSANTWITLTSGPDTTITANFDRIPRTLTVNRNFTAGGGVTINGTVNPTSLSNILSGVPIPISATPAPGYDFVNWIVNEGNASIISPVSTSATATLSSNATISANFRLIEDTLILSKNITVAGTVAGIVNSTPYTADTSLNSVSLPVTRTTQASISATDANDTYRFDRWVVVSGSAIIANENARNTTVALGSNVTIRANYLRRQTEIVEHPDSGRFAGEHPFSNFSANIPATIEVYALGAGGGGQGGHTFTNGVWPFNYDTHGTGGAGGGGAAAYMKFDTTNTRELFRINVGRGGAGGTGRNQHNNGTWQSGVAGGGSPSTDTTVSWSGGTLTVQGGQGGGLNDRDTSGGAGGAASIRPSVISSNNWRSEPGHRGGNGHKEESVQSRGGDAGVFNIIGGSFVGPFGGGLGSYRWSTSIAGRGAGGAGEHSSSTPGRAGGDGYVVIYITHYVMP